MASNPFLRGFRAPNGVLGSLGPGNVSLAFTIPEITVPFFSILYLLTPRLFCASARRIGERDQKVGYRETNYFNRLNTHCKNKTQRGRKSHIKKGVER